MRSLLLTSLFLLAQLGWANSTATTAPQPTGHTIGSADFNSLLEKQIKPGALKTETLSNDAFELSNTLQSVAAHINKNGVTFTSIGKQSGKGEFSLNLTQWGREPSLTKTNSQKLYREGDVVFNVHDGITERFTNTGGGIRQDFIVANRPDGKGDLHVQLQIENAQLKTKHNGVVVALNGSNRELTYDRLAVTDSAGKSFPASIKIKNKNTLDIVVSDESAKYPLTIDPTVGDENWVSMGSYIGVGAGGVSSAGVYALIASGNNVYVGGNFTVAGGVIASNIAKWDGSSWSALGSGVNGTVRSLALDRNDNLIVAGDFTIAGNLSANRVAKWNGSDWSALGAGMNNTVYALAVNSQNVIYAAGEFTTADSSTVNRIARWDGSSWQAFNAQGQNSGGMQSTVYALVIDSNDILYAGGGFSHAGSTPVYGIAKWSGGQWFSLGGVTADYGRYDVFTLALDNADNLYAGGLFTYASGVATPNHVAKWNGSAWSSVGSGGPTNVTVTFLTTDKNNNLYVGADVYAYKWNGSAWSQYQGFSDPIKALIVDGNDNLYAGGLFRHSKDYKELSYIAKSNGSNWDPLNGSGLSNASTSIAIDSKGIVYVGGIFSTAGGVNVNYVTKWSGTSWEVLASGMNGRVNALAVDGNDNLYVGGDFTLAGGVAVKNIAKWDGIGWSTLDYQWWVVTALAIDSNNNLYVGALNGLVSKWNGSSWTSMDGLVGNWYTAITALIVDKNDTLYAGGSFGYYRNNSLPNYTLNGVAKWNGSSWEGLGRGIPESQTQYVKALALDSYGNLYAGGGFQEVDGQPIKQLAKWDGTSWSGLGSFTVGSIVDSIIVDKRDNIYVGGNFLDIDSVSVNRIAKWNGVNWSGLGSGLNGATSGFALTNDGRMFVVGGFTIAGDKVSAYAAFWQLDTDEDGVIDLNDNCSLLSNVDQLNTDGDAQGDACDTDDDNDGVLDINDAFPLDSTRWATPTPTPIVDLDTDGDGLLNSIDTDDDGDRVLDVNDAFPLDASESVDSDHDGAGNNADTDDDNDGILDIYDSYPLDDSLQGSNGAVKTDAFGSSVAYIGDVNNDGYGDYIVGAYLHDVSPTLKDAGSAQIISGKTGQVLFTFNGDAAKDYFGFTVAKAGDVNGDSTPDVVVGAYLADKPNGDGTFIKDAGAVKVFSGSDGSLIYQKWGTTAKEYFGYSVSGGGDVDGDEHDDIVVGVPLADKINPDLSVVKDAGKIQIFVGSAGDLYRTYWGDAATDNLGRSVAIIDNIRGGLAGVIAGAPLSDNNLHKDSGYARIYSPESDEIIITLNNGTYFELRCVTGDLNDDGDCNDTGFPFGERELVFYGEALAGDNFGSSVGNAGDVDGDGRDDVIVGAYKADIANPTLIANAGSATVYSSDRDWYLHHQFTGSAANDYFGFSVSAVGDINVDGYGDVAISSYAYDAPIINSTKKLKDVGRVTVYSGQGSTELFSVNGTAAADYFGWSLGGGDTNHDNVLDILVGASKDDVIINNAIIKDAGSITVISGAAMVP